MTQQVSSPPPVLDKSTHVSEPIPPQSPGVSRVSRLGIFSFLALTCVLMLLFTGLSLQSLSQSLTHARVVRSNATRTVRPTNIDLSPLVAPGQATAPKLHLSEEQYVVYEQENGVYVVSTLDGTVQQIATPGYVYNRAIPPLVTPTGQIVYSGDGLWLTDIFNGTAKQLATLPTGQVITSLALSSDASTVAWSTEPVDGIGNTVVYAGPLEDSSAIYTHDATDCPCFRVFSFLHQDITSMTSDSVLLLTDDRGDHHSVQYGLWTLNLTDAPLEIPQPLLDGSVPQGPLALSASGKTLLYSPYQGVVPQPGDGSAPPDVAGLNYANSISVAPVSISGASNEVTVTMGASQVIVASQLDMSNEAAYHWITTPLFSADGHTLVYVEFSNDAQSPFARHSALYMVHVNTVNGHMSVSKPKLIETANVPYVELGTWLNNDIITFYADNILYALNVNTGAMTQLIQTKTYARTIAVWNTSVEGKDS